MAKMSPMMLQYFDMKELYKDCILFFRLGDFYEMFFDDAILASKELEITLTGRDCGQEERAPMCGVPFHSADGYIAKLVSRGYKVAICEQMESPAMAKGIVTRDVVRIVTPGTVTNENMLDEKNNNYLATVYKTEKTTAMSFADITTGEIYATKTNTNISDVINELARYNPSEIIFNKTAFDSYSRIAKDRFNAFVQKEDEKSFDITNAKSIIEQYFKENTTTIDGQAEIAISMGAMLTYLERTQKAHISHINRFTLYESIEYMQLDVTARRNLEITQTLHQQTKKGSLLWVLDKTKTSMGARLLKAWLDKPLMKVIDINKRLLAVSELKDNLMLREDISDILSGIYDVERIISRVALGSANPRDLVSLKQSLLKFPELKYQLNLCKSELLTEQTSLFDELIDIKSLLEESISEDVPATFKEGGVIKKGYNAELDKMRMASGEGKSWLSKIEADEREKTGIKNLKVSYNKVFGYYIEVTNSYLSLVPDYYVRKQTLSNCERYIIDELKKIETLVLGSDEKALNMEMQLFAQIKEKIANELPRLNTSANVIATVDVLVSLAQVALKNSYIMPIVDEGDAIKLKDSRHPVVERVLRDELFVPNDVLLDTNKNRLAIVTGPNMAGKSTYMRQVALISLMAQIGSFVPASKAKIGVVDKIFTRIGASDDLSSGKSTFMVEMSEMANILNNATKNSLVILDEIGRGTSTYDGLSIAWSVAEYIANRDKLGAKTLFATHYHELCELENSMDGVKNYSIAVKKRGDDVIFLRKIVKGGADDSYGVEVAALAGLPNEVIMRAKDILYKIENQEFLSEKKEKKTDEFDSEIVKLREVLKELQNVDVNTISPIEAWSMLQKLKQFAVGE